jgi:hypothetical protein
MGRKKKFEEASKVLTVRVPESQHDEIKTMVYRLLENGNGDKDHANDNKNIIDKLVLLMIKAGINSEKYGINIDEGEIMHSINRLTESGLIG